MIASRYSVRQSSSVAGFTRGSASRAAASPRTSQPAAISALMSGASMARRRARWTSSVSAAPQTPVRRILALTTILQRLVEVGRPVDVDVHDALEMGEDGHARLALHPLDEALAAARHDDVERPAEALEHLADRGARGERRARDRRFRQPRLLQPRDQAGVDRGGRVEAVRAAAQHHGVAAFQAERAGVRGDVRPALVDDADDAERRRHPLDDEAVRAGERREHPADRIGQRRDVLEPAGHRLDARLVRAPAGRGKPASDPWPCLRRGRARWRRGFPTRARAGCAPPPSAPGSFARPARWRARARPRAPRRRWRASRRGLPHRSPALRGDGHERAPVAILITGARRKGHHSRRPTRA